MVFEWAEAVVVTSASGLGRSRELTPELVAQARVIPSGVTLSGFDSNRRAGDPESPRSIAGGTGRRGLRIGEPGRRAEVVLEAFRDLRPDTPTPTCCSSRPLIPAAADGSTGSAAAGGSGRSGGARSMNATS